MHLQGHLSELDYLNLRKWATLNTSLFVEPIETGTATVTQGIYAQ